MGFKDHKVKSEYRSLIDNVVQDFYIPLLRESVSYKRAVGFFSSSSLVEISKGIANAIILSAAADYRAALKKVKRNPKSKSAIDETLQIEKFFRSSWYQQLTSVDGEFLIRKLQDEIRQSE